MSEHVEPKPLVARLAEWRADMVRDHALAIDGRPEPTEEKVLGQFLYSAICDLFESDEWYPKVMSDAWEHELDEWVNWYSAKADDA